MRGGYPSLYMMEQQNLPQIIIKNQFLILYEDSNGAKNAVEYMNGRDLLDSKITVSFNYSKPKPPSMPERREYEMSG